MPVFKRLLVAMLDLILAVLLVPAALLMKRVRRLGLHHLPRCRATLIRLGVFPIQDHYYEPLFNPAQLRRPLSEDRDLPGIDWNESSQLALLSSFTFAGELDNLREARRSVLDFDIDNPSFGPGDAEIWYSMIRGKRPRRIIEIGSGNSTLMAIRAIKTNRELDAHYQCEHTCIEPFEKDWLERTGVAVIRQRCEDVPLTMFDALVENDILFIDSSHIIRPQGDVLFECLRLLPRMRAGVIVHFHDVFSPKDYPDDWIKRQVRFWNEQYLVEAFLTSNRDWKIIAALNFMRHKHFDALSRNCPYLTPAREPGSLYIQRLTG